MNKSISANGRLHVDGINLVNEQGEPIQLTGMSSHGLQWYPEYTRRDAVHFVKEHGASLWRIAMYTDEDGYIAHPDVNFRNAVESIDGALAEDMYVIIDWHILMDRTPLRYREQALDFFQRISRRYGDEPGLIYEICNEPNGDQVTWENDIVPYAGEIIPAIRENAPHSLILVGTASWCQDLDKASEKPLDFENIMYSCHFYAGSHGQTLRDRVDLARDRGCAVFVSEFGTTTADGKGDRIYTTETDEWMKFMDERNLSWANWSFGPRDEESAALKPDTVPGHYSDDCLTESGKYVFSRFRK